MPASVVLLLLLAAASLAVGDSPNSRSWTPITRRYGLLLPFTMQMTLIIVLSSALAQTPPFRNLVAKLATVPSSTLAMVALPVLLNTAAAYLYWGLSIALAPVITVLLRETSGAAGHRNRFPLIRPRSRRQRRCGSSDSIVVAVVAAGCAGPHFLQGVTGVIHS